MKPADIRKLGTLAYHQCLIPLKNNRQSKHHLILGLDTEFESKTRRLLTLQLSFQGHELFLKRSGQLLTFSELEEIATGFLSSANVSLNKRHCRSIKLVCYFSIAETQHILDLTDAKVFETSTGVDFTWKGKGGRSLEIIDLMKFFNNPAQPLRKVAKAFGYEKLEWDTTNVTAETVDAPGFREYAMNDAHLAENIYNDLRNEYLNSYGVDILFTKTPAQTSSAIFRSHYLDRECKQPNIPLRKLALTSAWGGRNEAFRRGVLEGDIYEYDAFSEYPNSVIGLGILPAAEDWRTSFQLRHVLENHGFARVRFTFPETVQYPCLPVFSNSKLYYPLSGESDCTNAEIQLAHKLGAEIELIEGYYYKTGTDALARYMTHFLAERVKAKEEGNGVRAHVIKLSINSLIGKFIQRVVKTDLNALLDLSRASGMPVPMLRKLDPATLAETCESFGLNAADIQKVSVGNSFYPEWNSLILGFARAATSAFIVHLAEAGYSPLICSTDSVIFDTNGKGEPDENYWCGGIRFERRERAPRMAVLRTRLYRLGTDTETAKIAHHAVARRENADRLFSEWEQNPDQEIFAYQLKRIRTFRESLSYGHQYGSDHWTGRNVRLGYDGKRQLRADGSTEPWKDIQSIEYLSENPISR